MISASASFTRPADAIAYTAGDLLANSVTAGAVVPLSFTSNAASSGVYGLRQVEVKTDKAITGSLALRLHLWNASPTATLAAAQDNLPITRKAADNANYVGFVDLPASAQGSASDTVSSQAVYLGLLVTLSSSLPSTLYGLLEVTTGFTPGNGMQVSATVRLLPAD